MANSDWTLGVEIKEFENLHNAEKRGKVYCCCDDDYCKRDIMALGNTCGSSCETYFVVRLQKCTSSTPCSTSKALFIPEPGSLFGLSSLIFHIPFGQTTQDIQVRAIIPYIKQIKLCMIKEYSTVQ